MDFRDGNDEIYYKRNPTCCLPVGIGNELVNISGPEISIYPNPASSTIHIRFRDNPIERSFLTIRNILGEIMVSTQILTREHVVNVSTLQNGLYFVEIVTPNKKEENRKLIIRR